MKSRRGASPRPIGDAYPGTRPIYWRALDGRARPFIDPEVLAGELRAAGTPLSALTTRAAGDDRTSVEHVRLRTEVVGGTPMVMSAWLARPIGPERVAPILYIPGGHGRSRPETAQWIARECGVMVLSVDWLGCGDSTPLPGLDPAPQRDAIVLRSDDWRASYQFHNIRAFLRSLDWLRERPDADPSQLMVAGGSWGGFYSWVLAGIEPRIRAIFPTFGCGFFDGELRSIWRAAFEHMGPERSETWLSAFDPGRRAHLIDAEVHYETATNDKFFGLTSAMRTWDAVRTPKHLLLVHNQDHFMRPYNNQAFRVIRHLLDGAQRDGGAPTLAAARPAREPSRWKPIGFRDVRWVEGTNRVAVRLDDDDRTRVGIVWSAGSHAGSFGRRWRTVEATKGDHHWIAEIPIVDPNREIWFYAHADRTDVTFGESSLVQCAVPALLGVERANQRFEPFESVEPGPEWRLPVGDRVAPAIRVLDDPPAMVMTFEGRQGRAVKGVIYGLEGDLVAREGYDALDIVIRVDANKDLASLWLLLVSAYQAWEEETWGFRLTNLDCDFANWQRCRIPFTRFKRLATRAAFWARAPERPFDAARLCGTGFYHGESDEDVEVAVAGWGVTRAARTIIEPWTPPHSGAAPFVAASEPPPLLSTALGQPSGMMTP